MSLNPELYAQIAEQLNKDVADACAAMKDCIKEDDPAAPRGVISMFFGSGDDPGTTTGRSFSHGDMSARDIALAIHTFTALAERDMNADPMQLLVWVAARFAREDSDGQT